MNAAKTPTSTGPHGSFCASIPLMIVAISVPCGAGMRAEPMPWSSPGTRLVEQEHRPADDRDRDDDADEEADLLADRRRADEVAGLEVLRRGARVRGGDAHDGADQSAIGW